MSARTPAKDDAPPKPTDLLIRQKCEAMIAYGYVALRQSVTSWCDHAKHANTWLLRNALLQQFTFQRKPKPLEPSE